MARILLADDETAVREFVRRALDARGHEVIAVPDGLAALEALGEDNPAFDLLLTDIRMPGMDGITLSLKASRDWPDMPIMMMTGYADEEQRAHNLDTLIQRVVIKPFTLDEICRAVDDVLGAGPAAA